MIYVVLIFLWVALLLYLLLGGADFGAGIVELFSRRSLKLRTKKLMYKAIGPIWEANHMWLIIAIVILFVGFPTIYSQLSTYLHLPLVIMLLGIIARGTSFTFRNYDVVEDRLHQVYDVIFTYASFITPLFLGIIAASTVSGSIDPEATHFIDAYVWSWLTPFNVSVGLFTVCICGFLASIYSINTTEDATFNTILKRNALNYTAAIFTSGVLVFVVAFLSDIPLLSWIFDQITGYISAFSATLAFAVLIYCLKKDKLKSVRVLAGYIVLMILIAASYSHYPNLVLFKNGSYLSLFESAAASKSIDMLAWALLLGSVFILPFLFYLIYSFNKKSKPQPSK